MVVSYPAKVQIFQLITTEMQTRKKNLCCFLPCKGTNFSANHNEDGAIGKLTSVVSYPAKVQIFQLITTYRWWLSRWSCCFLPCKGTNFSANHNNGQRPEGLTTGCFLPCKGTNFSANHNNGLTACSLNGVVSYPAKVQIFQLITTIVI